MKSFAALQRIELVRHEMQDALVDRPTRSFLLIDDDKFSARFFIRQLKWRAVEKANVVVKWMDSAPDGLEGLNSTLLNRDRSNYPDLVVVDLKGNSSANLDFVQAAAPLLNNVPIKLVVFASICTAQARQKLMSAGAHAVFERHSDLSRYGDELSGMLKLSAQTESAA